MPGKAHDPEIDNRNVLWDGGAVGVLLLGYLSSTWAVSRLSRTAPEAYVALPRAARKLKTNSDLSFNI